MAGFDQITLEERSYLRELAKKQLEYANLPIMEERKQLWYAHNALNGTRPMVVIETDTFLNDIIPTLKCQSQAARQIEHQIMKNIINHEMVDDDKVIPNTYAMNWDISRKQYGVDVIRNHASDGSGHEIGYKFIHPITDLERDFHILKSSSFHVDKNATYDQKSFIEEIIGDILPVVIKNDSLIWDIIPSCKVIELMGLEAMMLAIMDTPELVHALYRYLTDDIKAFILWQQAERLLILNNGNDYVGAGSYGFTTELPTEQCVQTGKVSSLDLWGNMNSQETVSISPSMYKEFTAPYYQELSELFGLTYYGCCEPVDRIWASSVSKYHGLRKVSISPWCDERYMGDVLKGGKVIYSRKPSPNFMGVDRHFDEQAFVQHIKTTLDVARGCSIEFIYRDVYTLCGDLSRPSRVVKTIRKCIDEN